MSKYTYIFIINKKAGSNSLNVSEIITDFCHKHDLKFRLLETKAAGHATKLSYENIDSNNIIVAVGGDGTVNEVAQSLINTNTNLAVLPLGSGNGLARSLNIPISVYKSLTLLINPRISKIDVGFINEKPFFCTAGIGFDAVCAYDYAHSSHNRGLANYVKVFFRNFLSYKTQVLNLNNKDQEFYSLTFANANQYGNNAYIAPFASLNDGLLDMVLIKPHPKAYAVILGIKLFLKNINKSKWVNSSQGRAFEVSFEKAQKVHIDGESLDEEITHAKVKISPMALNIIHA